MKKFICGGSFRSKVIEKNDQFKIVKLSDNTEIKLLRSLSLTKADKSRKIFVLPPKVPHSVEARKVVLESASNKGLDPTAHLRPLNPEITAPRIDSYRFSMANLEDSQDVDLDAILGELCALETVCDQEIGHARDSKRFSDVQKLSLHESRTHSRSSSEASRGLGEDSILGGKNENGRTESPDNDSAFSDTVSMLSSESSASSGGSGAKPQTLNLQNIHQDDASRIKAEKIRMAMEKIKEANIQKLFVKVFTTDGSAKSLLVDEKMLCSYVTRLLADKNHVKMDPKWAIVEHLPDLYMERFYEDHELLVNNLLLWTTESKNKIFFVERHDKIKLFTQPEQFLLSPTDKKDSIDYDEHSRNMLLEDFFSSSNGSLPEVEGPLYLKADSKKGWKKYHFILRAPGLYYFPKEKIKSAKDLVCLATFDNNHIYYGIGWKKKFKAPTDFCFAIKHPKLQGPKSTKYIKYLCAEDAVTLEKWIIGMRIAKFGKRLMYNYRALMDELAQEEMDILASARSCSVQSIAVQSIQSNSTTPTQGYSGSEAGYGTASGSEIYSATSEASSSSGRHSRASSSSSSGCMSDGASSTCENAFDSEFPMGTIKRKPSMKPNLPLTNMTRQLKEVGETRDELDATLPSSPVSYTNNGTLTRRHSRRKSNNSGDDSSNQGTLKRQHSYKTRGSIESMGNRSGNSTPLCGTPVRERASPFGERNSPFGERPPSATSLRSPTPLSPNGLDSLSSMTDSIISLPPPPETNGDVINDSPSYQLPPPPPEVYNSNLSLDSLPPPPNPHDLPPITGSELTGSQLSLMSLPPPPGEETGTIRRRKSGSNTSSATATPTNVLSPERTPTQGMSPDQTPTHSRLNTPCASPPSAGSNCSTPTQTTPTNTFSPNHRNVNNCIYAQSSSIYGQNHDRNEHVNGYNGTPPPYINPPQYRQAGTLPGTSPFANANGLRSSLRQTSLPRQVSCNSIASTNSSNSSGNNSVYSSSTYDGRSSPKVQRKVAFQEPNSPKKNAKKISFNLTPQEVPPLPKKPPPPRRSETTKLSSPKKLAEPPTDFLKDLQRVMRKKWQVAQKCKLEPETTPHEVLGFRDPPALLPDYKEHNVSNWVKEHYGPHNVYENVYGDSPENVVEYISSPMHLRGDVRNSKRPPPPPPKRSETTHLSTSKMH
ncbi:ras-associated and pleckstrin homology domains-containing protein 1 [Anthonomus grandis grandis]|uniref:ras-associated and pleckstrin homology domains-containing protein 1 n=1 Tax=Anthonomus grandis grandis TaxID=2921223 RepID=UPI0021664F9B|nr:ras-associated and pleckstrin homology domains-containing protein 1 [Anthonomus grandis grandis]